MNEVERFLQAHPPFGSLTPDALETVARSIRVGFFPTGDVILRQGGTPSDAVFVIRKGSVALIDGDRVIDLLEPGELFGHPSLLTGDSPMHTVRATDDALCYLIPRDVADDVFGSGSGVAFLVASLEERARARAKADVRTADPRLSRVGTIASASVPICTPDTSVRDAAERMTAADATAALVVDGELLGIVTDSDLRVRVVAAGRGLETPIREVMTAPVRAIDADRLAHEALLEMLDRGLHHLPVVADGALVGLVSDLDLLGLERRDPFVLRSEIERAPDRRTVGELGRRLPEAAVTLARASVTAEDLGHVMASILDAMTTRLLELGIGELGPPPAPWAWVVLGSQARRERAIGGDQDHMLVLGDGASDDADAYFAELAEVVVAGLEAAGVPRCPSRVMATEPAWRRSRAAWLAALEAWIAEPAAQAAFVSTIAFDHRQIAGPLDVSATLSEVARRAGSDPRFVWRSTKLALEERPPIGVRGTVRTTTGDGSGAYVDVKAGGLLPIVDLARVVGIQSGSADVGTVARLRAAAATGHLPVGSSVALVSAFGFLQELRLRHQVRQIEAGRAPDDLIDPDSLDPIERGGMRDAFRAIAHVQDEARPALASRVR